MKTLKEEIIDSLKKNESLSQFGVRMAKENNVYVNTPQYYKIKKDLVVESENAKLREEIARLKKSA